ncbi:MAG: DUF4250 domain-containing protein [Eubacteriales bacterium]|nr:DUF4250 domain-containing protein [Eubacteriales bacterium]
MREIPQDPVILMSYLNTLLRDRYGSLSELCEDMELSEAELKEKLSAAGFDYSRERNRFA